MANISWLDEKPVQLEFLIIDGMMFDPGTVVSVHRYQDGSVVKLIDSRKPLYINYNYDKLLRELYICRHGREM